MAAVGGALLAVRAVPGSGAAPVAALPENADRAAYDGADLKEASDEALYLAWRGGDASAGDVLAQRHCAAVLRFFSNKLPAVAEDLMQKTFLACIASTTPPTALRSFRGFLFGIARKQLLRHFEGRGQLGGEEMMSRVSLAALATTPTQRIAKEQDRELIHRALAKLPLDQQISIELYYWQKLSVAEVAVALGLSAGGTRAKLHRARQRLREEYDALSGGAALGDVGIGDDAS
jgi:RNA polymerase sigma-70 factor (ECF subfamily)